MDNYKKADEFFKKNKDRIFFLFRTYQMIETMLFMKLCFPDRELRDDMDKMNKLANTKTLGSLKRMYDKKFKKDEYKITELLNKVAPQRNQFMHTFWIFLAFIKDTDDVLKIGENLLGDYEKNANRLFDKVIAFKV